MCLQSVLMGELTEPPGGSVSLAVRVPLEGGKDADGLLHLREIHPRAQLVK